LQHVLQNYGMKELEMEWMLPQSLYPPFSSWSNLFLFVVECFLSRFSMMRKKIHLLRQLSHHPLIPLSKVMKYSYYPWDFYYLRQLHSSSTEWDMFCEKMLLDSRTANTSVTRHHRRRSLSMSSHDGNECRMKSKNGKKKQWSVLETIPTSYRDLIQQNDFRWLEHLLIACSPYSKIVWTSGRIIDMNGVCKVVSRHHRLPLCLVSRYFQYDWNWTFLFRHRCWNTLNLKILMGNDANVIKWKILSQNILLDPCLIENFVSCAWDWSLLSKNIGLPPQQIWNYPLLFPKWKWKYAFQHPRVCPRFWLSQAFCSSQLPILSKFKKWECIYIWPLLQNKFHHHKEIYEWASIKIISWYIHRLEYKKFQERNSFFKICTKITKKLPIDCTRHIFEYL